MAETKPPIFNDLLTEVKADQELIDDSFLRWKRSKNRIYRRTDQLFVKLLLGEWIFGIACAIYISPKTWAGTVSNIHAHIWAAVLLGGAIISLPVYLGLTRPGHKITRHTIAIGQVLFSALLIHLLGGRLEAHFHIFGSLAFLAFYRDWRVLITATIFVAADHYLRGLLWPQSIYGVLTVSEWRWLEHAAWVVFEDIFLIKSCLQGRRELFAIALKNSSNAQQIRKLRAATQKAEEASFAKSQFLANMSHEIRTPLNGMIGMVDLLKKESLTPKQKQRLNVISDSGDLLLSIINDILEISKIEAGKLELEHREFALYDSVEKLADVMAGKVYGKGLEFDVTIDESVPEHIVSDEARIRQVLMNLIGNATKFTPSGEISLNLKMAGEKLRFEVRDTGIGIPSSKLKNVFETFSQVDVSDTRKYGGSGLGLTICQEIIKALGGQIAVDSMEGEGSCFWFEIPFETSQEAPEPKKLKFEQGQHTFICILNYSISSHWGKDLKTWGCKTTQISRTKDLLKTTPDSSLKQSILLGSDFFSMISDDEKADLITFANKHNCQLIFSVPPDLNNNLLETYKNVDQKNLLTKPLKREQVFNAISSREIFRDEKSDDGAEENSKNGTLKILIAEDNMVNQMVCKTMVEGMGFSSHIANNGQEAVDHYMNDTFDLILMDCQMPVKDGYQAALDIRKHEEENNVKPIPIVALTANALRETKEKCFECGMNGFLTKPIKSDELLRYIQITLSKFKDNKAS